MEKEQHASRAQAFVDYVLSRLESDRGMGAKLRRADNPDTEYQSWEYLARFTDLENDRRRRAFALVGAALARDKPDRNGSLGLGRAIAAAYDQGADNKQARARLRRLLACASTDEACDVLRPMLRLVASRQDGLDYVRLLNELLYFNEKTKTRWAGDFFQNREAEENTATAAPESKE